jgi:hypothetical protein
MCRESIGSVSDHAANQNLATSPASKLAYTAHQAVQ